MSKRKVAQGVLSRTDGYFCRRQLSHPSLSFVQRTLWVFEWPGSMPRPLRRDRRRTGELGVVVGSRPYQSPTWQQPGELPGSRWTLLVHMATM